MSNSISRLDALFWNGIQEMENEIDGEIVRNVRGGVEQSEIFRYQALVQEALGSSLLESTGAAQAGCSLRQRVHIGCPTLYVRIVALLLHKSEEKHCSEEVRDWQAHLQNMRELHELCWPGHFWLKPREFCLNKDYLRWAFSRFGSELLRCAPDAFFFSRDIVMLAVSCDGLILRCVAEQFLRDPEIITQAVLQNPQALSEWIERLPEDEIPQISREEKTRILLEAVRRDGLLVQDIPPHWRTTEVVLAAVQQNGLALQFIPEEMIINENIVEEALKNNPRALIHVPARYRTGERIRSAVVRCWRIFRQISTGTLEDSLFIEIALQDPSVLQLVGKRCSRAVFDFLCEHRPIVARGIAQCPGMIDQLPQELIGDEVILEAVRRNPCILDEIGARLPLSLLFQLLPQYPRSINALLQHVSLLDPLVLGIVRNNEAVLQYLNDSCFQKSSFLGFLRQAGLLGRAVAWHPNLLQLLPKEYVTQSMVSSALSRDGLLLKNVRDEDKNVALVTFAVQQNGLALQYVPESLQEQYIEIVRYAIAQNPLAIQYVAPSILRSRDGKVFVLDAIAKNPSVFQYIDEWKNDLDVALRAVSQDGGLLLFVHDSLKANRLLVLSAVRNNPDAFLIAHPSFRDDLEIAALAVAAKGGLLQDLGSVARHDERITSIAVCQDPRAFVFCSPEFFDNREIVTRAVRGAPEMLEFASERLRSDPEIVLMAVQQDPRCIQFAGRDLPESELVMNQLMWDMPLVFPRSYEQSLLFKQRISQFFKFEIEERSLDRISASRLSQMLYRVKHGSTVSTLYVLEEIDPQRAIEYISQRELKSIPLELLVRAGQQMGMARFIDWLKAPMEGYAHRGESLSSLQKRQLAVRFRVMELNKVLGLLTWDELGLRGIQSLSDIDPESLLTLLQSMPTAEIMTWLLRPNSRGVALCLTLSRRQYGALFDEIDDQRLRKILFPLPTPIDLQKKTAEEEAYLWNRQVATNCDKRDLVAVIRYLLQKYQTSSISFVLLKMFENAQTIARDCGGDLQIYWLNDPKTSISWDVRALSVQVNGEHKPLFEATWLNDFSYSIPVESIYKRLQRLMLDQDEYQRFAEIVLNANNHEIAQMPLAFQEVHAEIDRLSLLIQNRDQMAFSIVPSDDAYTTPNIEDEALRTVISCFLGINQDPDLGTFDDIEKLLGYLRIRVRGVCDQLFPVKTQLSQKEADQRSIAEAYITVLFLFWCAKRYPVDQGFVLTFAPSVHFFVKAFSGDYRILDLEESLLDEHMYRTLIDLPVVTLHPLARNAWEVHMGAQLIDTMRALDLVQCATLCRAWLTFVFDDSRGDDTMPEHQARQWRESLPSALNASLPEGVERYLASVYCNYAHVLNTVGLRANCRYPMTQNGLLFSVDTQPMLRTSGSLGSALAACGWEAGDALFHDGNCGVGSFLVEKFRRAHPESRDWDSGRWTAELSGDIVPFRTSIVDFARQHREALQKIVPDPSTIDDIINCYGNVDEYTSEVVFRIASMAFNIPIVIYSYTEGGEFFTDGNGEVQPTYRYDSQLDGSPISWGGGCIALMHNQLNWIPLHKKETQSEGSSLPNMQGESHS